MKKTITYGFLLVMCFNVFIGCKKDVKAPSKVATQNAVSKTGTSTTTTTTTQTTTQNQSGHSCGGAYNGGGH